MPQFEKKLVAVINKSLDPGPALNALAHMCIALGASCEEASLHLITYVDKEGTSYPPISKMPFIILKGSSGKIHDLVLAAHSQSIPYSCFTDTMTVGTWEEQIERTKERAQEELEFYGIVLFGDYETVSELTRKFSLYK